MKCFNDADDHSKDKAYVLVGLHGFFVSETDEILIDKPNDLTYIAQSLKKAYNHNIPFGFKRFYKKDGNKTFIDHGWIYIDGKVKTLEEVLVQNDIDKEHEFLASNMKNNKMDAVIMFENGKAYPFDLKNDIRLEQ